MASEKAWHIVAIKQGQEIYRQEIGFSDPIPREGDFAVFPNLSDGCCVKMVVLNYAKKVVFLNVDIM